MAHSTEKREGQSSRLVILFSSLFLLQLGAAVTAVALPVFVLKNYGVGSELGIALGLRLIPAVLAGGMAAWALDRIDARVVAVVSTLATAAATAAIPLTGDVVQLYVLSVIGGFTGLFATPAVMKLRASLIAPENAVRANGLIVSAERLPMIIGPAASAGILVLWDVNLLLFAEAATTLIAGVLILGFPRPADDEEQGSEKFSLVAIFNVKLLWSMAGGDARTQGYLVTGLFYTAAMNAGRVFLATLAAVSYEGNSQVLGWFLASMAVGAVLGGLIGSGFSPRVLGPIYLLTNILEGVVWISMGFAPHLIIGCIILAIGGVLESLATTAFFSDIQLRMNPHAIGRFFSIFVPLTSAAGVVGSLMGAAIVHEDTLIAAGVVIGLLIAAPLIPYIRTYWRHTELPTVKRDEADSNTPQD
ncbi:MFS transporter [Plantibacter sp. RU18]|uniref:MFS transporter n=1 Tax=Plantibacter sp. RU18 TaxID=3158143 RepID=UPI003D35BF09